VPADGRAPRQARATRRPKKARQAPCNAGRCVLPSRRSNASPQAILPVGFGRARAAAPPCAATAHRRGAAACRVSEAAAVLRRRHRRNDGGPKTTMHTAAMSEHARAVRAAPGAAVKRAPLRARRAAPAAGPLSSSPRGLSGPVRRPERASRPFGAAGRLVPRLPAFREPFARPKGRTGHFQPFHKGPPHQKHPLVHIHHAYAPTLPLSTGVGPRVPLLSGGQESAATTLALGRGAVGAV
jgi:hypothetical protein